MADFHLKYWALLDLQYEYLDDGFKLTATTDTPCHLFCRMTTTEPLKHSLPSYRRGIAIPGDVRFCFVVYEDNEQAEVGDTLTHTWYKSAWPICEYRWFYFVGNIAGVGSVSQSCIFKFHFPAPPPEPPPPILRVLFAQANNRTIQSNAPGWAACWAGAALNVLGNYAAPNYAIMPGVSLTASFWAYRAFLTYDTSVMPDTAKIQSAFLDIFPFWHRRTSSVAFPYLQATPGHQSDPVVIGDWFPQGPETLVLGQIDYGIMVDGTYNQIPLNPDGLSHINLTGLTKYCLRAELDVINFTPALGANWCWFYSEQKGAGYYPALHIYYYPA